MVGPAAYAYVAPAIRAKSDAIGGVHRSITTRQATDNLATSPALDDGNTRFTANGRIIKPVRNVQIAGSRPECQAGGEIEAADVNGGVAGIVQAINGAGLDGDVA